jgi:hypothetical protein
MRLITLLLLAALLAACAGAPLGAAPTQTAIVIVAGTSPLNTPEPPTSAPPDTATPSTTVAPSTTPPPSPSPAPSATPVPQAETLGDPLLRAYQVMVSMQLTAALLAETAERVTAGELEADDTAVAGLAVAALVQSVDSAGVGVTPPPELAEAWQTALDAHTAVKAVAGDWLLGAVEAADLPAALAEPQADLEMALSDAEQVVAAAYAVDAAALTEYRQRIPLALERLFE